MVVNIVPLLVEAGFSDYEARAYLGLLKDHPATAYQCARISGIPSSKIYEVLTRLIEKNIALEIEEDGKKKYAPIRPGDLCAALRHRLDSSIGLLEEALSRFESHDDISYVWNLSSYTKLMEKARLAIESARRTLLVSAWKQELGEISSSLIAKQKKKLKIAIVHFGKPETAIGQVFPHPIEDTLYSEKGGRGFALVSDSCEVIIGTIFSNGSVEGAWSRNRGFVTVAEDYIKHDIYIMKIVERFDSTLVERFGPGYEKLRDIFSNEEAGQ
jgi:sugar-specific transcriptional regulator TrmB